MERKIKFLFFFLFLITKVVAQREFAPIGAEWYFSKVEDWNPPEEGFVKFSVIKDTTIVEIPARIIERKYYTSSGEIERWTNEYIHQSGDTIFYFREGEFKVLYNFSLSKGDTMAFYADGSNPCNNEDKFGNVIIDSVYIQSINEIDLKTFLCSPIENSAWGYTEIVEGVGHYGGFYPVFNNTCDVIDFLPDIGDLRCYSDNEINLKINLNKPCDTIVDYKLYIYDLTKDSYLRIFPNPADEILILKFNNLNEYSKYVEIFSINGQSIFKKKMLEINRSLDISSLTSGLYTIKIVSDRDRIFIQKFVKL